MPHWGLLPWQQGPPPSTPQESCTSPPVLQCVPSWNVHLQLIDAVWLDDREQSRSESLTGEGKAGGEQPLASPVPP